MEGVSKKPMKLTITFFAQTLAHYTNGKNKERRSLLDPSLSALLDTWSRSGLAWNNP